MHNLGNGGEGPESCWGLGSQEITHFGPRTDPQGCAETLIYRRPFYRCHHGPPAPAFAPQVTSKYPGVASPHYNPEKGPPPHNTMCVAAVRPTRCCSQDI